MPAPIESDGITAGADALLCYLKELDTYWKVCEAHRITAIATVTDAGLQVSRHVRFSAGALACLRASIERLPGWEKTPFWLAAGKHWKRLTQGLKTKLERADRRQLIALRGVEWEERALLVNAFLEMQEDTLQVDVLQPSVPLDLPDLPLRAIASILRCHEHVLPVSVTPALPFPPSRDAVSLEAYLRRATPQDLCVSQCFWLPGAER